MLYTHDTIIHLRGQFVLFTITPHHRLIEFDLIMLCSALTCSASAQLSIICFCTGFLLLTIIHCTWAYYISCCLGPSLQLSKLFFLAIVCLFWDSLPLLPLRSGRLSQFVILCRVQSWDLLADIHEVRIELFAQREGKWLRLVIDNFFFFSIHLHVSI